MNSFKTSSSSSSSSTSHMPLPVKCDSHVQAFCLASWDIKPKSCCQSSFRWRPWVTLWSWSMFVISLLNFLLLMLWPLCISELSPHIQKPLWEQWVFTTDITCVLWETPALVSVDIILVSVDSIGVLKQDLTRRCWCLRRWRGRCLVQHPKRVLIVPEAEILV